MPQYEISQEQKLNMLQVTNESIEMAHGLLKKIREELKRIRLQMNSTQDNATKVEFLTNMEKLYEYNMLLGLVIIDLATMIKFFIRAEHEYEYIFAAKQMLVIINEGTKKIYHYTKGNRDSERKNSFWVKNIREMVDGDSTALLPKYEEITKSLNDFIHECDQILDIQKHRGYAVHYDKIPSDVFDLFETMDMLNIFQIALPFLQIMNSMLLFSNSLSKILVDSTET